VVDDAGQRKAVFPMGDFQKAIDTRLEIASTVRGSLRTRKGILHEALVKRLAEGVAPSNAQAAAAISDHRGEKPIKRRFNLSPTVRPDDAWTALTESHSPRLKTREID
jgi:hypothetical protein